VLVVYGVDRPSFKNDPVYGGIGCGCLFVKVAERFFTAGTNARVPLQGRVVVPASLLPLLTIDCTHNIVMPMVDTPKSGMPAGALPMLILRVLQSGSLHGYAIAQRIHLLSSEVLGVEEGLLYPTLQKILVKGWVTAEWGISETNRKVRFYRLTPDGRKHLKAELSDYDRVTQAIQNILRTA
jgi:PadR family transcriptional regulator, regulatory protein PadR